MLLIYQENDLFLMWHLADKVLDLGKIKGISRRSHILLYDFETEAETIKYETYLRIVEDNEDIMNQN
jgi:hypothetical protein